MARASARNRSIALLLQIALLAALVPAIGVLAPRIADATPQECQPYTISQLLSALKNGGSDVTGGVATVKGIPDDACAFPLNLSAYALPFGELQPWDEQELHANTTVMLSGQDQEPVEVTVGLPECAWQADLYLGEDVLGDEPGEDGAPHDTRNPDVPQSILVAWDKWTASQGAPICALPPTLTLDPCLVTDSEATSETGYDSAGTLTNPNDFPIEVTFGGTNVESVNGVDTGGDAVTTVTVQPGTNRLVFSNSSVGETITTSFGGEVVDNDVITDDCAQNPTVSLDECLAADGAGGLQATGTLHNPNGQPIDVSLAGAKALSLDGSDLGGPTSDLTLPPGTSTVVFDTATVGTVIGVTYRGATADTAEVTDTCDAAVDVEKLNNADGDETFTDDETAPGPGLDVPFMVVVANTGELAGTVTVVDEFGDTSLTLFGPEADVATTCLLGDAAFGVDDLLQPGDELTCTFTLPGYSPPVGAQVDNVVTATLTPPSRDPVDDEDPSTVRTADPDVTVDKTNDADGDETFTDDETAPEAGADVPFTVVVSNTGDQPGTIVLVDAYETTTLSLFGPEPDVATTCLLGEAPFGVGDLLQPGEAVTCTFTLEQYSPAPGERLDNTVTATLTPQAGEPVTDEDPSTVRSPELTLQTAPEVLVVKDNDANGDGIFSDSEFAPAADEDVEFRVLVTNTGDLAGQVRLFDALDDGSVLFLFGLEPGAGTDVATTCSDFEGAPFGPTDLLVPGGSIECSFTLPAYSPAATVDRVNTVTAELVSYTLDGDEATAVEVLADDDDPSTVASNQVLGETDQREDDESSPPADDPDVLGEVVAADTLPASGADASNLGLAALVMLALGAVLLGGRRREDGTTG